MYKHDALTQQLLVDSRSGSKTARCHGRVLKFQPEMRLSTKKTIRRNRRGDSGAGIKLDEELTTGFSDEAWERRSHLSYTTDESCHYLISAFIVPTFTFLNYLCISPVTLSYDIQTDSFRSRSASWIWKGLGLLLLLISCVLSVALSRLRQLNVHHSLTLIISKLLTRSQILVSLTCFAVLLRKREQLCQLLNRLYDAFKENITIEFSPPSKSKIRALSVGMLLGNTLIALTFVLGIVVGGLEVALRGFSSYMDHVANIHARAVFVLLGSYSNVSEIQEYKLEDTYSRGTVMTLGIVSLLLDWWVITLRCSVHLLVTQWAMTFWLLLHYYFKGFGARSCTGLNVLHDLRKFNEITAILDQFNVTLGAIVLTTVVAGAIHFSVNLLQLFLPTNNVFQGVVEGVIFFGFMGQLIASAQVHYLASGIVKRLKIQYQEEPSWHQQDTSIETTQGILFLMHEVETNTIGIQGLGFFTCSYSLIGTVLSVIVTYAVVVVQFQDG